MEMDRALQRQWEVIDRDFLKRQDKFLHGQWQKEMPSRPGVYPAATREGSQTDDKRIILSKDKKLVCTTGIWMGWWWSEPRPHMPPTPNWDINA